MPDTPDAGKPPASSQDLEDIPVDELIRLTREFTRRITNQDRQRLGIELRESGHSRSIQVSAPATLQQFFSGEIDLDTDLARRFANAPLMSHIQYVPRPGEPIQRQATAILNSNDDAATVTVDAHLPDGENASLEVAFTLFGALALRFALPALLHTDRTRWLELVRRDSGIAFLWTRQRWEQPYLIFVIREFFARLYAFSPHGFEAAVRLTPDMVLGLANWLEEIWFPERRPAAVEPVMPLDEQPTTSRRPPRSPLLRPGIPDAPEEQWDDQAPPEEPPPDIQEADLSPDTLDW